MQKLFAFLWKCLILKMWNYITECVRNPLKGVYWTHVYFFPNCLHSLLMLRSNICKTIVNSAIQFYAVGSSRWRENNLEGTLFWTGWKSCWCPTVCTSWTDNFRIFRLSIFILIRSSCMLRKPQLMYWFWWTMFLSFILWQFYFSHEFYLNIYLLSFWVVLHE